MDAPEEHAEAKAQSIRESSPAEPEFLVVRDREPAALHDPPPIVFEEFGRVRYLHVSELGNDLPPARHYVFNCNDFDAATHRAALAAARSGARLTFITQYPSRELARLVERHDSDLIPAYGVVGQITAATFRSTMRQVLHGRRMKAEAFLAHSAMRADGDRSGGEASFAGVLAEASVAANGGARVVVAVLALQRTGSKFLHDLIGFTVSGRVAMFHEHAVPAPEECAPLDGRPLSDQVLLERDSKKRTAIRKAILRERICTADRRYIVVSERAPEARLASYFQMKNVSWLKKCYKEHERKFRKLDKVQEAFNRWAADHVAWQRRWYREQLVEPFGLNVLDAVPAGDGVLVARQGANTLVVVRTPSLNHLRGQLAGRFGTATYDALHPNSAAARGAGSLDEAFRRLVRLDAAIVEELYAIPEVAYLHGPGPARLS